MLCTLILNGQTSALREMPWTPGVQFEIVTISIDPRETFALAREKKELYLTSYERPAPGWHFLVDHQNHARQLAEQVGFHYRYDDRIEQYAHSAAIIILSEDGTVSRYLYGIQFPTRDLRLALTEASEGKIGSAVDKLLLFCYRYDPASNSYVPFATNIMRAGGVLAMLTLGGFLFIMWRRDLRRPPPLTPVNLQ
jgi:protein SCO1/2